MMVTQTPASLILARVHVSRRFMMHHLSTPVRQEVRRTVRNLPVTLLHQDYSGAITDEM